MRSKAFKKSSGPELLFQCDHDQRSGNEGYYMQITRVEVTPVELKLR